MIESLKDYLKSKEVAFKENVKLSQHSPVRIGGIAPLVIYPRTVNELIYSVNLQDISKIPPKILGRKSNILFADGTLNSILIDASEVNFISFSQNEVSVGCGASIPLLSRLACSCGLSGFEELSGIPGSVGGAIVGNAGAFGKEICDVLYSVIAYDRVSRELIEFKAYECDFSYRKSLFCNEKFVILSAKLRLSECSGDKIRNRILTYREKRIKSQPTEPSLGSTFKRPSQGYAGEMIEKCGLSGFTVGGTKISEKHAGFIVNIGGATAADYMALMKLAADKVYEQFSVKLQPEIKYVN